ncbi:hypothetical protein L1049_013964 [Liquidambar formosana]|uniref:Uncharacterized protein n=1 Tax=Liquidambar formosana TaxID=63359 RepID=A0AAP0RR19_LIQFO
MEDERESSSMRHKLKSTICFSCCPNRHETLEIFSKPRLIRSSSTWLKSTAGKLPEIREKCRNLISWIGKSWQPSAEFRYDPLSYALNFNEGYDDARVDEFPLRSFSTRLPASPPTAVVVQTKQTWHKKNGKIK